MRLTENQLEEAGFIFEKENGHPGDSYTRQALAESSLTTLQPEKLEKILVDGLNKGLYEDIPERVTAYWALGKRFNQDLIPEFKKWLKSELLIEDQGGVYQILIVLGNMGEPVFNEDRDGGSSIWERELNFRDARNYLSNDSA